MSETQDNMEGQNSNGEEVEMSFSKSFEAGTRSHAGPILGVIIIMLVFVLGGLYVWGSLLSKQTPIAPLETPIINNEPETPRADADTQILETLSPSDELEAIEADLESTNLGSIDADLNAIDAEFNAAIGE